MRPLLAALCLITVPVMAADEPATGIITKKTTITQTPDKGSIRLRRPVTMDSGTYNPDDGYWLVYTNYKVHVTSAGRKVYQDGGVNQRLYVTPKDHTEKDSGSSPHEKVDRNGSWNGVMDELFKGPISQPPYEKPHPPNFRSVMEIPEAPIIRP